MDKKTTNWYADLIKILNAMPTFANKILGYDENE